MWSTDDTTPFEIVVDESEDAEEVDTDSSEVDTRKAVVVAEYVTSDDSLRSVVERHDTTHETLRNWVEEFEEED